MTLRVVLDQLVAPTDPDLADASGGLAQALVDSAPQGCGVAAILPAEQGADAAAASIDGLGGIHRSRLSRRDLARAWQLGAASGVGAGMIHSPTMLAPLVKHDRVHDNDQTVVTLWDLTAWIAPKELARSEAAWQRAMLKRAVRHADAVVVPTHSLAERLIDIAPLGDRIRVIAGAVASGFGLPTDAAGRSRTLALPETYVAVTGGLEPSAGLAAGLSAASRALEADPGMHVVVVDAAEGSEPAVVDLAAAGGIPERRVHVRGRLDPPDRATLLHSASALVAPSRREAFPWRVLEALELAVPLIAIGSGVHRDVLAEGGLHVGDPTDAGGDAEALGDALTTALQDEAHERRLRVLAHDRSKAFSWREAAERVWQLHADL